MCDRNVNAIAPFIDAPSNRNESILHKPGLEKLKLMFDKMGKQYQPIIWDFFIDDRYEGDDSNTLNGKVC